MGKLLYQDLMYEIRAALSEVYSTLGPGLREETYKLAVLAELRRRQLAVACDVDVAIQYKGEVIDNYRLEMVVEDKVILELKAIDELHPRYEAQLLSYLRASGLRLGLLVNFGSDQLHVLRKVN